MQSDFQYYSPTRLLSRVFARFFRIPLTFFVSPSAVPGRGSQSLRGIVSGRGAAQPHDAVARMECPRHKAKLPSPAGSAHPELQLASLDYLTVRNGRPQGRVVVAIDGLPAAMPKGCSISAGLPNLPVIDRIAIVQGLLGPHSCREKSAKSRPLFEKDRDNLGPGPFGAGTLWLSTSSLPSVSIICTDDHDWLQRCVVLSPPPYACLRDPYRNYGTRGTSGP